MIRVVERGEGEEKKGSSCFKSRRGRKKEGRKAPTVLPKRGRFVGVEYEAR